MKMESSRKKGFTLIELLVVIAIIAILAAILFPVFARARENARRASCQSNMKQIALGVFQYTQDYDEKYPRQSADPKGIALPATTTTDPSIPDVLNPYVKSLQIYRCPSSGGTGKASYHYNGCLNGVVTTPQASVSIASFENTAQTMMMRDAGDATFSSDVFYLRPEPACTATQINTERSGMAPVRTHFNGNNFSFADGHVKWLAGTKAATPGVLLYDSTGTL